MKFKQNDGGRKKFGFKGTSGDCATRAIAIATKQDYSKVYKKIRLLAKEELFLHEKLSGVDVKKLKTNSYQNSKISPNTGTEISVIKNYLLNYRGGKIWRETTLNISSYESGILLLNRWDIPEKGTFIISIKNHLTCVVNGILNDTWNCDKNGEAKVISIFWKKSEWDSLGPFAELIESNKAFNNHVCQKGINIKPW